MKLSEVQSDVLFMIAEGRADAMTRGVHPPYVAHLLPKRAAKLRLELARFGTTFGVPFTAVPHHRNDAETWRYLGIVLDDVHVYARDP